MIVNPIDPVKIVIFTDVVTGQSLNRRGAAFKVALVTFAVLTTVVTISTIRDEVDPGRRRRRGGHRLGPGVRRPRVPGEQIREAERFGHRDAGPNRRSAPGHDPTPLALGGIRTIYEF